MPPKGMIITVGVGRGIDHAIVVSVHNANPERIIFLVTKGSRNTLERIKQTAEDLGVVLPPYEEEEVRDETDAEAAYEAAVRAIQRLAEEGMSAEAITIDYTSGSKPMSAGALYAAVTENCNSIVYVTGERDDNGRVISGTERVFATTPNKLFARRIRSEGVQLFNAWQFAAAERLLDDFLCRFPRELVQRRFADLEGLYRLCRAYRAWDAFDHLVAQEAFEAVDKGVIDLWSEHIGRNKGWVNQVAKKLQEKEPAKRLCKELLVDLWANAGRRLEERRFVDAVARLYRLSELLAQFRLWHVYGIDTGEVDMNKVPENMRRQLESYRNERGKVQIPLKAAYELLAALGDELGGAWREPKLRDALRARNESIAAHGLQPVTEEVAKRLKEAEEPLLKAVVPELNGYLAKATFPRLT